MYRSMRALIFFEGIGKTVNLPIQFLNRLEKQMTRVSGTQCALPRGSVAKCEETRKRSGEQLLVC